MRLRQSFPIENYIIMIGYYHMLNDIFKRIYFVSSRGNRDERVYGLGRVGRLDSALRWDFVSVLFSRQNEKPLE